MADPINTSTMPGDNMDPDNIETAAGQIRTVGSNVSTTGGDVAKAWAGLKKGYHAPEQETLFGAMRPAQQAATGFGTDLGKVATALETFAGEVRTIKANVAKLRTEANAFLATIHNGKVTVTEHVVQNRAQLEMGQSTTTHHDVDWNSDQATVDQNNALIRKVNDQQEQLWAAERKCANAIRDVYGATHISAASESNPNGYGVNDIPDNANMPWGHTVSRKEDCGDSVVKGVGDFLGGIGKGITGLVGVSWDGWHPSWSLSTAGHNLWNFGKVLTGLSPTTPVLAMLPGPVGDYYRSSGKMATQAVAGLVGIDPYAKDPFAKWKGDPVRTGTSSVLNVASFFIPGGGEASGAADAAKGAGIAGDAGKATRGLDGLGDLAKITGEGGDLSKVGRAATKTDLGDLGRTTSELDDTLAGLGKTDIDVPNVPHDHVNIDHPNVGDRAPGDVPPARDPGQPAGVDHQPAGVDHQPGGVDHQPGGVDHQPGGVDHQPGDPNGHNPSAHDHSGYDKDGVWHYQEKGDPTWNNHQKAAYGEKASDAYMQAHHYERVDNPHVSTSQNGIDAIYRDPETGKYAIVESKWGKNSLSMTTDGRQMSDSWLRGRIGPGTRIQNAVGGDARLAAQITRGLSTGNVEKFVANVYPDGTVHLSALGPDGQKLGAVDVR